MIYKIPNRYLFLLLILFSVFLYFFVFFANKEEYFFIPKYFIKEKEHSILFFGDLMLDRGVKRVIDREGIENVLGDISKEIDEFDVVVANLEGVFSSNESVSLKDKDILRFTFDKKLAGNLLYIGFDILSQANNHTFDFGEKGILESKETIRKNSMEALGDYFNINSGPIIRKLGKRNVAFFSFNQFGGNLDNVKKNLNSLSDDYLKIVFCHWGNEYEKTINNNIRKIAHELVLNGADIVIGAHPHVIQPIELYNNSLIFYSLGNFVFDQDFSKETTEGLAVGMILTKNKIKFSLLPFNINYSVPRWKSEIENKEIFDFLYKNSLVPEEEKNQINDGYLILRK